MHPMHDCDLTSMTPDERVRAMLDGVQRRGWTAYDLWWIFGRRRESYADLVLPLEVQAALDAKFRPDGGSL